MDGFTGMYDHLVYEKSKALKEIKKRFGTKQARIDDLIGMMKIYLCKHQKAIKEKKADLITAFNYMIGYPADLSHHDNKIN